MLVCAHNIHGMATLWRSDDNLGPEMGLRFSDLAAGASFLSTEPSQQSLVFIFIFNFLCLGVLPPSVYLHCVCAVSEEDTTTVWGLGLNQVLGALSH